MQIWEKFLQFIFPPTCGFCNTLDKNFICSNCIKKIKPLIQSKINIYSHNLSPQINKNKFYFHEHFYLFKYESDIREKIIQYKFHEDSYLYKTFAKLLIEDKNFQSFIQNYNCITCVPLHEKRLKKRGYNQSDLIAKEVAQHFNIAYCNNLLIKKTNIVAQSTLNKDERLANIQNAFELNRDAVSKVKPLRSNPNGLKIAIFDDIFTTGSTANECAKNIHLLEPSKIGIVTLAKD